MVSNKFDIVRLYYPNNWRKNVGTLVSDKDKKFNWFLCSQRIYDPKTGSHIAKISPNIQFYCETTGKTLLAQGLSQKGENIDTQIVRPRLLIVNNPQKMTKKYLLDTAEYAVENFGYDGVAVKNKYAKDDFLAAYNSFLCGEIIFIFADGILIESTELYPDRCGIIRYAKLNNLCIKQKIIDFPSCDEIDKILVDKDCSDVSKVLYSYLTKYLKTGI
uniref:Uncharacterized protein n=1 Tax=Marseillevirus LCMAC102 TaxID=2506603 RepID=A0A481YT78_9VIRU|nr:MAG: hypothetical protein LCMAC102_02880 [Marseillevirus LCMAC102]